MCGIAAVQNGTREEVEKMGDAMQRRGVERIITEIESLKVCFNWLPTTDPSPQARQPFTSTNNYITWLNGYISNYRELANKYNIELKTNSDSEFLSKFIGMFELRKLNELNGVFAVLYKNGCNIGSFTDRYGARQLYKSYHGVKMYYASEVKSLLAVQQYPFNENAIKDWKYSLGVMTPDTIYDGIERVKCLPFTYPQKIQIDYEEAKEELRRLFTQSINRNKSTLKNCVFLSGGVDSAIIAKYIKPDYCFSMDYKDRNYSEIENIKRNSLSKHITMICNKELFEEYKDKTMLALDDLKVGSSYTNFALTELASKFCTIIYSGAGGDEFFGGYPHRLNKEINKVIKRTNYSGEEYCISHFYYDVAFLRAVLVVEDRMAGYHTMETRYPLLDNDLVDFALSLPDEYLKNKQILKDISGLNKRVLNSKKRGFTNPYFTNKEWVDFALKKVNYE